MELEMRKVHDLKDLAMIYHDEDAYDVNVWQPDEQRRMKITFCGSSKPCEEHPNGVINFIATYEDEIGENCIFSAFKKLMIDEQYAFDEDEAQSLCMLFMEEILRQRGQLTEEKKEDTNE